MTVLEIVIATLAVLNLVTRGIPADTFVTLPFWLQQTLRVLQAVGPDAVKAAREAAGGTK